MSAKWLVISQIDLCHMRFLRSIFLGRRKIETEVEGSDSGDEVAHRAKLARCRNEACPIKLVDKTHK